MKKEIPTSEQIWEELSSDTHLTHLAEQAEDQLLVEKEVLESLDNGGKLEYIVDQDVFEREPIVSHKQDLINSLLKK